MKNSLIDRIRRELTVDTRNYRYNVRTVNNSTEQYDVIERLPLKWLDTTRAIDGWEIVARI